MKKTEDSASFSKVEYEHETSVTCLDMHVSTSLLYMKESAHQHVVPQKSTKKHSKLNIVNI